MGVVISSANVTDISCCFLAQVTPSSWKQCGRGHSQALGNNVEGVTHKLLATMWKGSLTSSWQQCGRGHSQALGNNVEGVTHKLLATMWKGSLTSSWQQCGMGHSQALGNNVEGVDLDSASFYLCLENIGHFKQLQSFKSFQRHPNPCPQSSCQLDEKLLLPQFVEAYEHGQLGVVLSERYDSLDGFLLREKGPSAG